MRELWTFWSASCWLAACLSAEEPSPLRANQASSTPPYGMRVLSIPITPQCIPHNHHQQQIHFDLKVRRNTDEKLLEIPNVDANGKITSYFLGDVTITLRYHFFGARPASVDKRYACKYSRTIEKDLTSTYHLICSRGNNWRRKHEITVPGYMTIYTNPFEVMNAFLSEPDAYVSVKEQNIVAVEVIYPKHFRLDLVASRVGLDSRFGRGDVPDEEDLYVANCASPTQASLNREGNTHTFGDSVVNDTLTEYIYLGTPVRCGALEHPRVSVLLPSWYAHDFRLMTSEGSGIHFSEPYGFDHYNSWQYGSPIWMTPGQAIGGLSIDYDRSAVHFLASKAGVEHVHDWVARLDQKKMGTGCYDLLTRGEIDAINAAQRE